MSGIVASIEPRLPPAMCGTSTYGWTLSRNWPEPRPRFVHLVVDGAEASRNQLGTGDIFDVGQSAANLAARLEEFPDAGVIVHYASRGFQRLGCPLWLSRGLSRWRRAHPDSRMLAFFHEVAPRLPMTSRHGILEWVNRGIIRRLARAANVIVTNTPEHAARLEELTGRRNVPFLPVPSNIPAPRNVDVFFAHRAVKDFVIFGLPFTQLLTVQAFSGNIRAWWAAGVLERLHLIGPADAKFSPRTDALLAEILPASAVTRHGALDAPQVSEVLARTGFCLTQSNEENFSKSGTFTAFAAHGCAVIAKMNPTREPLGYLIQPGEVKDAVLRGEFSNFEQRARALREWYLRESDWPAVSRRLRELFEGGV